MISPSKLHPRFWRPVESDPKLAADIEIRARACAGEGASPVILELARECAAAFVDLRRVWQVKDELSRGLPSQSFGQLFAAAKLSAKSPAHSVVLAIDRYEDRAHRRHIKAWGALDTALRRGEHKISAAMKRLVQRSFLRRELAAERAEQEGAHDLAEKTAG